MTNNLNPDALTGLLDKNPKLTSQNRERFRESIRKVTSEYMQLNGILSVVVGGSVAGSRQRIGYRDVRLLP